MLNGITRNYIKNKTLLFSTSLFILLFYLINHFKPMFLYKSDGSLRQFGIGYRNKTVFPIWILAIILAILCYLIVLTYTHYYRLFV